MRLELVQAPAAEPLTLDQAKQHLRVDQAVEDALITRNIVAARRLVEAHLRRKLITQTWRLLRDDFCAPIVLGDLAPVQSIGSVKYIDDAGAEQTLATSIYQLIKEAPARLELAYGQDWPAIRGDREGVRIEAVCGYGAADSDVPENIVQAMLLLVEHFYYKRGPVDLEAGTFHALLCDFVPEF